MQKEEMFMAIPYSRPIGDATALTFILHEPKEEILINHNH